RPDRFARVREEVKAESEQIVEIAEFLHPRVQEIADTLPEAWGRWLMDSGWPRRLVERFTRRGRVVKTSTVRGFLMLYAVAALKPTRPRSLRFKAEQALLESWLATIAATAPRDYALAVEVATCRTLVKGYSDTHERGCKNFKTLMALVPDLAGAPDAAAR